MEALHNNCPQCGHYYNQGLNTCPACHVLTIDDRGNTSPFEEYLDDLTVDELMDPVKNNPGAVDLDE